MELFRESFQAMGGECEVLLAAADAEAASALARAAIDEVLRIERTYSRYRPDSFVGRANAAAGSAARLHCDEETRWLLDYAETLYQVSDGLFDITSGVLRQAWDFQQARLPDPARLQALLGLVGWRRVERVGDTLRLPEAGMEIDFGGFGKEYAADRAAVILSNLGVRHGYVNLGGDLRVIGPRPDGSPWVIGIEHPRQRGEVVASIPVFSGGLATSGDYQRFFELDGQRYCHVLNPRTGYPVHFWRSVSILAPVAVAAGSHTTIAMLKEAQGLDFLKESGFSYLAVDAQGAVFTPPNPT